jgi:hypothetical protein
MMRASLNMNFSEFKAYDIFSGLLLLILIGFELN